MIANNNSPYPTSDLDGRAIKGEFVGTTYSVGVWTNQGDGGHLDAYDASGTLIGSANVSSGGFGGIVSPVPIASFAMVCTFNGDINFGIYDLQFSDCIQ